MSDKNVLVKTVNERICFGTMDLESLGDMQTFVGGLIEPVPLKNGAILVCNEEGVLRDMPHTAKVYDINGNFHAIRGSFFVCSVDGENFAPLPENVLAMTPQQAETYFDFRT